MTLTSIIHGAASFAYKLDTSLGIDYEKSMLPTRAGLQQVASSTYRRVRTAGRSGTQYTAGVLQREMFNKSALKKGAKIVGLTAAVYAALC